MIGTHHDDDRGVSIAVTHALTIGITTILVAMLLMSASTMLETETDRSTRASLETVGERLADEIGNADQIGSTTNGTVTVRTDHPRTVSGSRYTIELRSDCDTPLIDSGDCLTLTAHGSDIAVSVPIKIDADVPASEPSVTGGSIEIRSDGDELRLTEGER